MLNAVLDRWPKATRAEKGEILDHLVAVTGWHRDHARKAIRRELAGVPAIRKTREPLYHYSEQQIWALTQAWAVLDGPCGKVLQPALAPTLENLVCHGHLKLDQNEIQALSLISPATIDRRLATARTQLQVPGKGRSMTKPGSMLKSQIPMKTWAQWDDTTPGFVEIDLVAHEGGDNNGSFAHTLSLDRRRHRLGPGRHDPEQGREGRVGGPGATPPGPALPPGRANHSNDNAYVEQKNWAWIRRCAGYFGYDTPTEIEILNQLWPLETTIMNLFKPQQKLIAKTRTGAKVTRVHDTATTPLNRLTQAFAELLDPVDLERLNTLQSTVDLFQTRIDVAALQDRLVNLAKKRGPVPNRPKQHHVYESKTKLSRPPRTRAKTDESTNQYKRAS